VAVGDFRQNGILDLAVVNGNSGVSVLLGNGDGTFQVAVNYAVGNYPSCLAVGDFRRNGTLDLAVAFSGGVRMLLGNGDGTFQTTHIRYVAGSNPSYVAVGDFNGDSFPDLAVANVGSNDLSILLNDAVWPTGPGGAPGRRADQAFREYPLASLAVLATSRTVSTLGPDWIGSSQVARLEPFASPRLLDALFAATTRQEPARTPAEVAPVTHEASRNGRWPTPVKELDLPEPAIATLAWDQG
jgi:hypothetical protein